MTGLKDWLAGLRLEQYYDVLHANAVDFDVLPDLTEADLKELEVPLGDRKRLLQGIADLDAAERERADSSGQNAEAAALPSALPASTELQEPYDDEVRQLTLMFVDLVGSTNMANELNLEQYRETLQIYQNCCLDVIRKNFGYVAQFQGDGIVAYFGYPMAEENDAERAVLAGFDITQRIRDAKAGDGRQLEVRVGIATGDVLISELLRYGDTGGHFALGDIPNLAARLQTVVEPGRVAISDITHRLLGGNFDCDFEGKLDLKGFAEPVEVWSVRAARPTELRFEARQRGPRSPFVGRQEECALLKSKWQDVLLGEGQAVFICGEAGIGKSRLAEVLSEQALLWDAVRLSFQCSPYHQDSAFYPVIAHLTQAIDLQDSDGSDTKMSKILAYLGSWADAEPQIVDVYANLLSITFEKAFEEATPEELKERTFATLLRQIERISAETPVFVLFEDLHWVDPSTEELLDVLVDRLEGLRVMLLGTHRPDYLARWTGHARVTTLSLARLDHRQSGALVQNLLAEQGISAELAEKIVARAEGVPLFVEEMARMVIERDKLVASGIEPLGELELPPTLKDLLRAKIDNLPNARDMVSLCAALGRNFTTELVSAVYGSPGDMTQKLLDQLVNSQILIPRGAGRYKGYSFRHALIQEAAYEAMLPRRARLLHRKIAETYVAKFSSVVEQSPEVIAQHYWRAAMPVEARDRWRDAAGIAMRRYASQEAISHLMSAIEANALMEGDPESERKEIELREMLGVALETRSWGSPDILSNLDRLHELQIKIGGPDDLFPVLHGLCGTHLIAGNPDIAQDYCRQMDQLIAADGDPVLATLSAHNNGMAAFFLGKFDDAIKQFDLALACRAQTERSAISRYYAADPATVDTVMRCWARVLTQGPLEEGGPEEGGPEGIESELDAATAVAQAGPDDFSRCYGLSIIACIHLTLGEADRTLTYAQTAQSISRKIKFHYWDAWSSIILGWAQAQTGTPSDGIATLTAGLDAYIATGSAQIITFAKTLLAEAYLAADQPNRSLALIEEVRAERGISAIYFHERLTERVEAELRGTAEK